MPTDFRSGTEFPRRGRDEFGGFLWLLRIYDKARASANGTIGEYIYPCPLDRGVLERWGISREEFDAAVEANTSDEAILNWLRGRVSDATAAATNAWILREKGPNLDKQDAEEGVAVP